MKSGTKNAKALNELENLFVQKYSQLQHLSEEERKYIHRHVFVSTIGASTRIENAILTDQEIEWIDTVLTIDGKPSAFNQNRSLIENKLSKDRERSIQEVAGCRSMLLLIYSQFSDMFPFTESSLRGLHQQLLQYYPKAKQYLGKYKTLPNSVVETNHDTGKVREVFKTADAGPITESAMSDLVRWYNDAIQNTSFSISVSCEFVYRFLAIHPFQDGNGRVGRGLFLLSLLQSPREAIRTIAPYIAFDREIESSRAEYYFVLNQCSGGKFRVKSSDYRIEYFLEYMTKVLTRSLENFDSVGKRYENVKKLSSAATSVLSCFKDHPEIRLTTGLICEETGLARRTVANSLSTLLRFELIQRYGQGRGGRYQLTF